MAQVMELARFTIKPELEQEFLAKRPTAMAALRSSHPGLLSVNLVKLGGNQWMDVALWESVNHATTAAAHCHNIPEFAALMSLMDPDVSMEHADVVASIA